MCRGGKSEDCKTLKNAMWSVQDTINKLLVVDLTVSTLLCGTGAYTDNVSSIFYSTVYIVINLLPHLRKCLNNVQ